MNVLQANVAPNISFKKFILTSPHYRRLLYLGIAAMVIQWVIFKIIYPFPNFIHDDSFVYIDAAQRNLNINTHMIGYSKFLRIVSTISTWDTWLVTLQYLLIGSGSLFLLFTICYFYQASRVVQYIIFTFVIINPLSLHLANLVSSDGIFLAISLIWFGLLLWTVHIPSNRILVAHIMILFFAFTMRYNALIYPLLSILTISLTRWPVRKKWVTAALCILPCLLFMIVTSYRYKNLSGVWQYSPFSGWQWANNALYSYRYVDKGDRKPVPLKFRKLDDMVREYFDSTKDTNRFPDEGVKASTMYMWIENTPLRAYMNTIFKNDSVSSKLKKWASVSRLYGDYGRYIISTYPLKYTVNFLGPNIHKYFTPPLEYLVAYNYAHSSVDETAQYWFGYSNRRVYQRTNSPLATSLEIYPVVMGMVNILLIASTVCFLLLRGYRGSSSFKYGITLFFVFWILNVLFSIFSTAGAIRFHAFSMIVIVCFASIQLQWMFNQIKSYKLDSASNDLRKITIES